MVAFGWLSSIVPGLVTWDRQLLCISGKGGRAAGGPGPVSTWRHDGATPVKVSGLRSAVTLSLLSTRDAALPHLYVALLWSYLKQLVMLISSYNTATKESFADNKTQQKTAKLTPSNHRESFKRAKLVTMQSKLFRHSWFYPSSSFPTFPPRGCL